MAYETITIGASIAAIFIATIFIYWIIMPFNRKMAGATIVVLGASVPTIGQSITALASMTAIVGIIIILCGVIVVLDGFINKR